MTQQPTYVKTEPTILKANPELAYASGYALGSVLGSSILYFTPAKPIVGAAMIVEGIGIASDKKAEPFVRVFGGLEAVGGGALIYSSVSSAFKPTVIKQYNPETGRMVKTLQPPIQYQQKDVLINF